MWRPPSSSRCLGFKLCSSPEVRFRAPLRAPQKHPLQLTSSAGFQSEGGAKKKYPMLTCVQRCVKRTICSQGHFFKKNAQKIPMLDSIFAKRLIFREGAFLQETTFSLYHMLTETRLVYIESRRVLTLDGNYRFKKNLIFRLSKLGSPSMVSIDSLS